MYIKNQSMGLDNIFELFSPNNIDGKDEELVDFTKSPTYWVGMYKKLVLNHED